jgi:signal transduction histidine kinase
LGLSEAHLSRLFEPFYTTKPRTLRDGAANLPLDYRGARRATVGHAKRAAGGVFQFTLPLGQTD